jgi:hypothetical protein
MEILTGRKTRLILFVAALAFLLVFATTAGHVWHHHTSAESAANCPFCHLGHQTPQPTANAQVVTTFLTVGSTSCFEKLANFSSPYFPHFSSRAPPAA